MDASRDMESACVHGFNFMILLKNLSLQSALEKRKFTFSLNFSGFDLVLVSPAPSMIKILKLG